MTDEEEIEALGVRWDAVHSHVYKAYDAVQRLQSALELPFRPVPFQPIADLFELTNRTIGLVARLLAHNAGLEAEVKRLKNELEKQAET